MSHITFVQHTIIAHHIGMSGTPSGPDCVQPAEGGQPASFGKCSATSEVNSWIVLMRILLAKSAFNFPWKGATQKVAKRTFYASNPSVF